MGGGRREDGSPWPATGSYEAMAGTQRPHLPPQNSLTPFLPPPSPDSWMHDSFNVYSGGQRVPEASAVSFRQLSDGYAHDAFNVFHEGKIVRNASVSSFEVTGGGYAKDAFRTFYQGRSMR